MDFTIKRANMERFAIVLLIVGAFLLLLSVIRGTYMIVAFAKGIPLHTFSDIRINVLNVFFDFLIPFVGGVLLIVAGLTILKFRREETEHEITRKVRQSFNEKKDNMLMNLMSEDEKRVLSMVKAENGILQSDLVVKSGYSKVKMHRVLKKLENMDLIKRSRFGITNKIFLNDKA